MKVLFIGHTYIDITWVVDEIPFGDKKTVAQDYATSFGGNAVAAAFCCKKLGAHVELLTTTAEDWHGRMFLEMAAKYDVQLHHRKVEKMSVSGVFPNAKERAIARGRDDRYGDCPIFDVEGFNVLHVDGHQADAALYYANLCRQKGILTSLDGGTFRANTERLLRCIDVAVVSEDFCGQIGRGPKGTLDFLRQNGCKVGAVTKGVAGIEWYCGDSGNLELPAYPVPNDRVVDTNGAGDVFHGAYVFSYLRDKTAPWERHFRFASAAAAHSIQYLGIEAGLPDLASVDSMISHRPQLVRAAVNQ